MAQNKKYDYALPIGTILSGKENSYHIEEVLGQGGYGITYKVWSIIKNGQIPVKVPFAIKEHFVNGRCHRAADGVTVEYSQEAAEDVEESLKDFVKEGRLLNKICQSDDEAVRYVVPVNEVIEANNTAFYVMQYLEGGSLRDMVIGNHGGLPEAMAVSLIKPIARAVDYIHQNQILHMDIKPGNIVMHKNLLNGQDEPVLIDFGVSLHFNKKGGLTTMHTSIGRTEGFSPIEQYGAIETFMPQIDVYALGATLYYLLTGKIPLSAFNITPSAIDANLPLNVSERTRTAIKHAMEKEHHFRTKSASTFLWELENDLKPAASVEIDSNMTVKKKVTPKSGLKHNKNSALPVLMKRLISGVVGNAKRIGIALLLLVVVFGIYMLASSIGSSKKDSINAFDESLIENMNSQEVQDPVEESLTPTNQVTNEEPQPKTENTTIQEEKPANDKTKEKPNSQQSESKVDKKPEKQEKTELKPLTDAELFAKAKSANDWSTIESLGNKGFSPAYYVLALHYWNIGNAGLCKKWAQKAVNAGVQVEAAKRLLSETE